MGRAEAYFHEVMVAEKPGLRAGMLRQVASVAGVVYAAVMRLRNRAYERGWLERRDLDRKVVSVGNLSAGGTGKTPVVAWLARELVARGRKPAVLLRGYRASGGQSDEAMELAESIGGGAGASGGGVAWRVPVQAGADRVASAAGVLSEVPEVDVFLLDDGMQHRRVRRQVEVVLVSATQGLCGGHVLPRGLLRESPSGLARADVILLTRCDQAEASALDALANEVREWSGGKPVLRCRHEVSAVVTDGGERWSPQAVRGRRVFAVAGTGDPAAFGRTVSDLGAVLAGSWSFRDHHAYTPQDWAEVGRRARAVGAEAVVTTGKDWVKLRGLGRPEGLEVWVVRVEVRFEGDDGERMMGLVMDRL